MADIHQRVIVSVEDQTAAGLASLNKKLAALKKAFEQVGKNPKALGGDAADRVIKRLGVIRKELGEIDRTMERGRLGRGLETLATAAGRAGRDVATLSRGLKDAAASAGQLQRAVSGTGTGGGGRGLPLARMAADADTVHKRLQQSTRLMDAMNRSASRGSAGSGGSGGAGGASTWAANLTRDIERATAAHRNLAAAQQQTARAAGAAGAAGGQTNGQVTALARDLERAASAHRQLQQSMQGGQTTVPQTAWAGTFARDLERASTAHSKLFGAAGAGGGAAAGAAAPQTAWAGNFANNLERAAAAHGKLFGADAQAAASRQANAAASQNANWAASLAKDLETAVKHHEDLNRLRTQAAGLGGPGGIGGPGGGFGGPMHPMTGPGGPQTPPHAPGGGATFALPTPSAGIAQATRNLQKIAEQMTTRQQNAGRVAALGKSPSLDWVKLFRDLEARRAAPTEFTSALEHFQKSKRDVDKNRAVEIARAVSGESGISTRENSIRAIRSRIRECDATIYRAPGCD